MKIKFIISLLLISISSYGQVKTFDCDKILDQEPYFMKQNSVTELKDSLQKDLDILRYCGKLDSIDIQILDAPVLGMIVSYLVSDQKSVTYKTILNCIDQFRLDEGYQIIRASKILETKIVTPTELEKDKELLKKMDISESEILEFKNFIETNSGRNMTYKEAFAECFGSNQTKQQSESFKFHDFNDIDSAINEGKKNHKNVLLYFTCYSCANARRVEKYVLTDISVKNLMEQNFVCFAAYVDDKKPYRNTKMTIGQKYLKLQTEMFKVNTQPFFCIMDENGNVLAESGYTRDPEEFIEFLNKGIK